MFPDRTADETNDNMVFRLVSSAALRRQAFDRALMPRGWPLSTMLDGEPGWRRVYEDGVAVLFARDAVIEAKVIRQ